MKISLGEEVDKITEGIIGAAMEVSRTLGHGFLEAVYHKALAHELALRGFLVEEELAFQVCYKDVKVGVYQCEILVNHRVIVELKAVEQLTSSHVGQVVNYLRASGLKVGLLFNFGRSKLQFRRVLF